MCCPLLWTPLIRHGLALMLMWWCLYDHGVVLVPESRYYLIWPLIEEAVRRTYMKSLVSEVHVGTGQSPL